MARLIALWAVMSIVGCTGGSAESPDEPAATALAVAAEAEESSACRENADCGAEDRYCAKPPGECDGGGECLVRHGRLQVQEREIGVRSDERVVHRSGLRHVEREELALRVLEIVLGRGKLIETLRHYRREAHTALRSTRCPE